MAVTEKTKKIRLFKVAKEFNLAHDTLTEFLEKKGYKIKNLMSVIDEEMLLLIERQFKKEKYDAERHARKRKEFDEEDRRRRGDPEAVEEVPESLEDKLAKAVEEAQLQETASEVETSSETNELTAVGEIAEEAETQEEAETIEAGSDSEEAVVETVESEETPVPEDTADTEAAEKSQPEAAEESAVEAVPEIVEKAPSDDAMDGEASRVTTEKEIDLSIAASMPKMRGLTVKGKMDLAAAKQKAEEAKRSTGKQTADGKSSLASDKTKHKKKRKRRVSDSTSGQSDESLSAETLKKKLFKRGKKSRAREVDQSEVKSAIKKTIASMSDFAPTSQRSALRKKKRYRRAEENVREQEEQTREEKVLRIYEYAAVSEIAQLMDVGVNEVITSLISLGVMASINQRLDFDTITLVASEFGFDVQKHEEYEDDMLAEVEDPEETLEPRAPIVTIMGHVDHGKTKLLDHIRKSNVVAGESGGITQHIGAYTVTLESGKRITFLDTPGHEAFTAMRARGAQVTDIVILVVAADDNVMPQTVEAINHSLAAGVPIVVAINKIDRPEANPERIKQQLADRNVLVEDWGGKYGCVQISALDGQNVDDLLERVLLETDILELKANPNRDVRGSIIEAELDKGKGIMATVLVQKGTLNIGDAFVAGNVFGKVRAMLDERGNKIDSIVPSTPVRVLGFNALPQAGDVFASVSSDREAREVATMRAQIQRESDFRRVRRTTLDDISEQIKIGGVQDLAIVVKGDVDGSVEALADSLLKLSTQEVRVDVIHKSVGAISESDVLLAAASNAIIIGFHIRPNLSARKLAEVETVDIRLYDIIYDAIEDVKNALEGMLKPEISEIITATILVRDIFRISRIGTIAGCYVQDGKINRNSRVRLLRDGISIFSGSISSLKRFKEDVREVDANFECGISLDGYNDIKVDDIIEAFEQVETKRTLS